MMPRIDIRGNFAKWRGVVESYKKEIMPAAVRAMNRTQTSARAETARALRAIYPGMKVSAIKARIKLQRASRTSLVARMDFSGRRISLYGQFRMRAVGRWGVRFGALPWRLETVAGEEVSPAMLERAFRQRGPSGRPSVMARVGTKRYPIAVLLAPGVARAFDEKGVGEVTRRDWRERFEVEFDRDMQYRINRRG